MEEKILDFAPLDNLDGIVVAPKSYSEKRIQDQIYPNAVFKKAASLE